MNTQDIEYVHHELSLGKCNWSLQTWLLLSKSRNLRSLSKLFKIKFHSDIGKFYQCYNNKYLTLDYVDVNLSMNLAIKENNENFIYKLIDQGADRWKKYMKYASYYNQLKWVIYFYHKCCENDITINLNSLLDNVENIKIAKFLVEHGANNYDICMFCSSIAGHYDIVKYMVSLGAQNYDECMDQSSKNGHIKIVKLMLNCGATNITECIEYAEFYEEFEIVDLLKSKMIC